MSIATRTKAAASLLGGSSVLLTLFLTFSTPGLTPVTPADDNDSANCVVAYQALDPNDASKSNPNKEVNGAMGPAVTASDEAGIKAELTERRTCGADDKFDPALTATHYAEWSAAGLTKESVSFAGIDAFKDRLASDRALYGSVMGEINSLENASVFSTEELQPGLWSIYMLPNGSGGVTTRQGQTTSGGTAAVFTHGDKVIRYRLNCGFQPVHVDQIPDLPVCDEGACTPPPPPPVTPPTTPTPVCEHDCNPTPVCEHDCNPTPECTYQCDAKDQSKNVTPPGNNWTPMGTGPVTTGNESEQQQSSGQTSGNVTDNPVSSNTGAGDTTPSTGSEVVTGGSGPAAEEDTSNDVVDPGVIIDDDGGTEGATEIAPPAD